MGTVHAGMERTHSGFGWVWPCGLGLLILAGGAAGCGVIHSVSRDRAPEVSVPARFVGAKTTTAAVSGLPWWQSFQDDAIDGLVERLMAKNLDVRQGFARLHQAQAIARGAGSGFFPEVGLEADASRARSVQFFGQQGPVSFNTNQFNVGVSASYEVDLWGRVHAQRQAATTELEATALDLQSLQMTLSAETVDTWLGILAEHQMLRLLKVQGETHDAYLELVTHRFRQGLGSVLEVYQERQLFEGSRAQIPLARARMKVLEHQLAVLLGEPPGGAGLAVDGVLPPLPPLPATGIPAALILRRPDVQAAHLRVLSADYRVGSAIADRFPTIRLTARTGFRSFALEDLLDGWIWNLVAGIAGPLFDGGRRRAEVDRTRAVLEERVAGYTKLVLNAIREVEDALVKESTQADHLGALKKQERAARSALSEARVRYLNGLSDYLPVLTSLRALHQVEQAVLTAERNRLSFRVMLCRALAGGWEAERGQ